METLGIYIQVPFCASKCSFCNFTSQVYPTTAFEGYCHALRQEVERLPVLYDALGIRRGLLNLPVDSLYLGGGTPPLMGAERLGQILKDVREAFRIAEHCESTLEITPGSADADFLGQARAMGVNRLSIGAQSFDDWELRAVGRLHAAAETRRLVLQARRAGFSNINLDLIAGMPYQTKASWRQSLVAVGQLGPEHVSVYLFEADEKSRLGSEVLRHGSRYHANAVPDENFMTEAYETAREFLRKKGYAQYEISNFALGGYESRHNQRYWQLKPYIGLGAGAHSFDGVRRWANETAPQAYVEKLARRSSPVEEMHSLSTAEQLEEFFFIGLRQSEGVDLTLARRRWGSDRVSRWEPTIAALGNQGWLERRGDQVRLTDQAYVVSNEIFQEFLVL